MQTRSDTSCQPTDRKQRNPCKAAPESPCRATSLDLQTTNHMVPVNVQPYNRRCTQRHVLRVRIAVPGGTILGMAFGECCIGCQLRCLAIGSEVRDQIHHRLPIHLPQLQWNTTLDMGYRKHDHQQASQPDWMVRSWSDCAVVHWAGNVVECCIEEMYTKQVSEDDDLKHEAFLKYVRWRYV